MNILVFYASKRGRTEGMAERLGEMLRVAGHSCDVKNVCEINASALLEYEVLVAGSSTWASGDLADDFIPFEKEMDAMDFGGKRFAVFGPGDSRFPHFAEAVEILQNRLKNNGAKEVLPPLKVDGLTQNVSVELEQWAALLAKALALI